MIQNEFVPYEESLALKELGFDEPCFAKFLIPAAPKDRFRYNTLGDPKNYNDGSYGRFLSAPLWQQAFRWFREKYDLDSFRRQIGKNGKSYWSIKKIETEDSVKGYSGFSNTYEEAQLACLQQLIIIVKDEKKG